ncbi:glycosyl transferase family 1, partial [Candidatus Bathyarchaeota archaeon]|nr:glycosyl transferase family 1 [Candidatus Bathyarchaeota archaeon]
MRPPPIKLDFLEAITDDTGIFQHSKFGTPNRLEGYTTDDNSRALIALTKYRQLKGGSKSDRLIDTYLSFLLHMQRADGKMHNFLGYDRSFLDNEGSEDCVGRALLACGYVINSELSVERRLLAREIFDRALRWAYVFRSPRAKAFAILGLSHYHKAYPGDENLTQNIKTLSDKLLELYKNTQSSDWRWFEPYLTYVNSVLPQALFEAYQETKQDRYAQVAEESLKFLLEVQILGDKFVPIGNKGWYKKGGQRSMYDQQPVEASSMTEAAISAYRATGHRYYRRIAEIIFNWFLG